MFSVPCDDEAAAVDLPKLTHVGPPVGWAGLWPHGGAEIALRIDGDERAPYDRLVELARVALPRLEAIERASDAYLRAFINPVENFYTGSWRLRSLRLAWSPDSSHNFGDELDVTLCIGDDDYGEWSVRFLRHAVPSRKLRPCAFSRRQW